MCWCKYTGVRTLCVKSLVHGDAVSGVVAAVKIPFLKTWTFPPVYFSVN